MKGVERSKVKTARKSEAVKIQICFYLAPWFISYYRYGKGREGGGKRRWRHCGERRRPAVTLAVLTKLGELFSSRVVAFDSARRIVGRMAPPASATLPRRRSGIPLLHICRRRRSDGDGEEAPSPCRVLSSSSKLVTPPVLSCLPYVLLCFCGEIGQENKRLVSSGKQN